MLKMGPITVSGLSYGMFSSLFRNGSVKTFLDDVNCCTRKTIEVMRSVISVISDTCNDAEWDTWLSDRYEDDFFPCLGEVLKSGDPVKIVYWLLDITGPEDSGENDTAYQTDISDDDTCTVEIMDMRKKDMVCPYCGNTNHYDYCVYCLRPIIPAKGHGKGGHGRYSDSADHDIRDADYTVCDTL